MSLSTWATDLATIAGLEPQRINHILMHFIPNSSIPLDANLTICLESFPTPNFSVGMMEVGYLNEKRKFAGNPTWEDLSIVYRDLINKQVVNKLYEWWQLVYNPVTDKIGLALSYKRNAYVIAYGPDGTANWQWDCYGVWPNNFNIADADMGGEDYIRVTMGFVIDKCVLAGAAAGSTLDQAPAAYGTGI